MAVPKTKPGSENPAGEDRPKSSKPGKVNIAINL